MQWTLVNKMNEMEHGLKEMNMDYGLKEIKMKCD